MRGDRLPHAGFSREGDECCEGVWLDNSVKRSQLEFLTPVKSTRPGEYSMLHKQRITWLSLLGLAYRPLRQFAGFVGISYALGSSAALADSKPQAFQKGETVCMVGDSITHGGMYHSNLYLFYATRFPTREVRLVNCGISGDTAAGAASRLDWDVLVHRPTVATVLLGMNDVGLRLYGTDKTDEKSRAAQRAAIERYVSNMTALVERLLKAGTKVTLLTPTIYEQNVDTGVPNYFGSNDGLSECSEEVKKIARKYDLPLIDVHEAMNSINRKAQQTDTTFTLVGRDRVHPGNVGHFVIAYEVLKAQGMSSGVSKMVLDAASAKATAQVNCTISRVQGSPEELSFDCLESALPFPVAAGARGALTLIPFERELNEELLRITGLTEGKYTLSIDDKPVGQFDATELAAGVNLASNPKTPQYQQALEVDALNTKRHMLETVRLRGIAATQMWLANSKIDLNDPQAISEAVSKAAGGKPDATEKAPWRGDVRNVFDAYRKYKPVQKELMEEAEQARAGMYKAAQPKPHRFVIKKS